MKHIGRYVTVCLLILILCFATSCEKEPNVVQKDEKGTVYVLNGFESVREMFSVRPSIKYMSATMDIVDAQHGQVKSGEGSMRYTFEQGNWPEMVLHIRHSNYPELDIANLNKMNLFVYNDNEKPVSCVVSVVVQDNKPLLSQEYTLEPCQWNDLEFRLSSLACAFNADQIIGFRFRMEAEEHSVFYFDEWSVTMGAENTQEDDRWEPVLLNIIERINDVPEEPKLSDEALLNQLYMDYAELPELYRNIVPNYDLLKAALEKFAALKVSAEKDALECKFLAFDEFYGVGQLDSANYALLYQTDVKYEGDEGSIRIIFDGSTKESYFPYQSPLDAKRYDYLEIHIYNDDTYRKVVYFNWNQRVVIEPQTWGTLKVVGEELFNEGNIIVDTIDAQGVRIQSRGTVYLGTMRGYRRDLLAELKKLPDAANFSMDRDIKYLTLIENTMELYNKMAEAERAVLPAELVENLLKCYEAIAGYGTVVDASQEDLQFGTPDCAAIGTIEAAQDEDYGPVWVLDFTEKAPGDYAAGFRFLKEFGDNTNMFFYIYNPQSTAQTMELYADGNWKNLEMRTLEPGWNKIELPTDVEVNHFVFGLFSKNANVVGSWKVSSLYSVSDELVNRKAAAQTAALIQALPNAGSIKLPEGFRYVADIWQAYDSYEALTPEVKNGISSALKNKLNACLNAIDGYKAAINAKTDEMTVGTPDCICSGTVKTLKDSDFGWVYGLNITKIGTGDYAAGFQIDKDISADRNLYFYIFNPKATAQTIYLYANPSWDNMGEQVLAPGWNLIELPKNAKIDRYLFGLFPKNAAVTGQWKISSVYAKSDALIEREEAAEAVALLDALPDASAIVMPEDMHLLPVIYGANDSYNALSDGAKKAISQEQVAKLQACLQVVDGYLVAINSLTDEMSVGTADAPCQGTLDRIEDAAYGPVFALNITEAGSGDYAGGFQVNKDISGYKHRFFYIYNPQDSAQTMYLYADPSWKDLGSRALNPGWNLIELPDDIQIKQFIFGIFPASTKAVGQWKITSVYAKSDAAVDKEESLETAGLLDALPDADTIVMPDDLTVLAKIYQASDSYNGLSDGAKNALSQEQVAKLQACLQAVDGYLVAINSLTDEMSVGTVDAPCQGTLDRIEDETYGPVFALNITEAGSGDYAGGFQVNKDISGYKHRFFYIYNPQDSAQTMFLYADPSWKDLGARTLSPGWNLIELPDGIQIEKFIFGIFPASTKAVGQWMITSTYAISDTVIYGQAANQVENAILALPNVSDLTLEDKASVDAAKIAYEALPDDAKELVSQEAKDKLTDCVTKIAELGAAGNLDLVNTLIAALPEADALTVAYKGSVEEAKAAYDALSTEDQALVTNADKLSACIAKIEQWKAWDDKTLVSAAAASPPLVSDGTVVFGVDDNTFGKVWSVTNGTFIKIMGNWLTGEAAELYIYNPKDSDVTNFYYTADWVTNVYVTLKAKSWTRVRIENTGGYKFMTKKKDIYMYAAFSEGFKVSSLFSAEAADTGNEAVQTVIDMIAALPEADALTIAHKTAVEEAKTAYDALSAEDQALVTNADKLRACVEKLNSLNKPDTNIVVDASYQVLGVDGTLTTGVDNNTFGKVMSVSNSTYLALTGNVKSENAAFRQSKNIGFYIYNPTNTDVDGYYTMDWGFNAHFLLKAKVWNYIEFADFGSAANKQFITSTNTVYFYANMTGEGWLVSSFYSEGTNVEGLATVVDASYQVLGVDGMLTAGVENVTFGKVMSVSGSTYLALTPNVKTENPAFKQSRDIVFYIYNPTDTDVDLYYTMDWGYNAYAQLKANSWNRIHLSDLGVAANKQFITSNNTVYFYAAFSGEGWLISSFYGM